MQDTNRNKFLGAILWFVIIIVSEVCNEWFWRDLGVTVTFSRDFYLFILSISEQNFVLSKEEFFDYNSEGDFDVYYDIFGNVNSTNEVQIIV